MSDHDHDEAATYSMLLEWDPVDRIYVVTVPELPGCRTHGATYLEAVEMGHEEIAGWIDAARAWGRPVPPPHVYRDQDVAS